DGKGDTPLHKAVSLCQVAMVEELLRARANVNRTNRRDETPLDAAIVVAGTHAAQVVRILVRGGGDKDRMNGSGDTPLIAAIRHKSIAPLCALIDCSADMEKTDRDGATPLYAAAWVGFSGALTLLAGSVEVDKVNDCGDTALHAAAWQGHVDAVEQLVVARAITSKANADGDAPLHLAAQRGHVKVVHFLIDQQADLAKRNLEGATALDLAAANGHTLTVKLLEEACGPRRQRRVPTTSAQKRKGRLVRSPKP
ncbi:ANKRD50, partial [Symbiodinium sp. CCMP2456]